MSKIQPVGTYSIILGVPHRAGLIKVVTNTQTGKTTTYKSTDLSWEIVMERNNNDDIL